MLSFLVVLAAVSFAASGRTFVVKNQCSFDIWPALYTDPTSPSRPDVPTGWHAAAGSSRTFQVPEDWKSGRIWGRTECDESGKCSSGSCNGGIECSQNGGTGATPASLAEWTLNAAGGDDYYDVSLVDGFNLPMSITNNVGCNEASCPAFLNTGCPSELRLTDSSGKVVGCKSSCGWDGQTENSPSCCTGSHDTPETCPPSGVKFYSYFKDSCPNSYVYAYDESSNTALWTCSASKGPDYTLTFCPEGGSGGGFITNGSVPDAPTNNTTENGGINATNSTTNGTKHASPIAGKNATGTAFKVPRRHRARAAALKRLLY